MREIVARALCFFTVGVVLVLATVFASRHKASRQVAPAPVVQSDRAKLGVNAAGGAGTPAPSLERGRRVFEEALCSSCHSVEGNGNPRYPLDGVGVRRDSEQLKAWITGSGVAATQLPASVARRKQRYRDLPREDMDALIAYLLGPPTAPAKPAN